MELALARLVAALLRRRALALAAIATLTLLALAGVARLRLDFSSTAFYGSDDRQAGERLADFQRSWGADDDDLLLLIHPVPVDGDRQDLLTAERLDAIAALADDLRRAEQVRRVVTITDAPLPVPGAPAGVRTSLRALTPALADPQARAAILAQLPFVPGLLAADGRTTVVVVELAFSSDDVLRTKATVDALAPIFAAHDPAFAALGLERELAGVPAIRAGFFTLVLHDQAIFVPAMLLLIGLALLWVFRRSHGLWGVLIPALAAGVPTAILVGLMGWTGEPIGLLNQAYFTLLPVIAVADAIHLLARVHEERRDPGPTPALARDLDPSQQAIVRAGAHVGLACLLTSLTTAAGFASLAFADIPILRGFGLYAALGVLVAFVLAVTLVPLLLSFVTVDSGDVLPGSAFVDACARLACARPKLVLATTAALTLAALIPAARVRVDNTLSGLLEPSHPTSRASARVDQQLGGVLGLEFDLRPRPGPDGDAIDLRDPKLLRACADFEAWLAAQPQVRSVDGPGRFVAEAGLLLGEADDVPSTRPAVDARLAALADLADLAPLDEFLEPTGRRARIRAGMPDAGGHDFVAFAERARAQLHRTLADAGLDATIDAEPTGTALLAYRGVNRITHALRASFAGVFAVVVLVIGLLLRSPALTLLSLIPNLLPLLLGYALVGLVGAVLDPLAAVILTLTLGIAVDDTLHILVRAREQRRRGGDLRQVLTRTMHHSGRAVAVTSIVIAGGLVLNLGSSFPPMQMLGLLGAAVIVLALLTDLLVLPALLFLFGGRALADER